LKRRRQDIFRWMRCSEAPGVVLWRLAPFAIVLQIFKSTPQRRGRRR
jgi:hypothetical protein